MEWIDRRTDGWAGGQMDACMDGWMEIQMIKVVVSIY